MDIDLKWTFCLLQIQDTSSRESIKSVINTRKILVKIHILGQLIKALKLQCSE